MPLWVKPTLEQERQLTRLDSIDQHIVEVQRVAETESSHHRGKLHLEEIHVAGEAIAKRQKKEVDDQRRQSGREKKKQNARLERILHCEGLPLLWVLRLEVRIGGCLIKQPAV